MKKYFLCLVVAILMLAGISALAEGSAIPVISLDGDCLNDYANWNDKSTYYPATLTFTDGDNTFTKDIEIKPQGTDIIDRTRYDLLYVQNYSFMLDIRIMLLTSRTLFLSDAAEGIWTVDRREVASKKA